MKTNNPSTLTRILLTMFVISAIASCKKDNMSNNPQTNDPRLKWKYNTGKFIYYSSPAIGTDGTIYVGNGISGDNGTGLFAINQNGTQKWAFAMSNPVFTPSIASDGTIYVQDATSTLHALNSNGAEKWKYILNITNAVGQTSPAIDFDGTIYICADGVYAIRPDGSLKWHYNDPLNPASFIRTSPSLSSDSCIIVASTYPVSIWKLHSNGSRAWKCDLPEGGLIFSSPCIASDGTIYVGTDPSSDRSFLFAIRSDSTLKWKYTVTGGRPIRSSPSIDANGTIYVGTKASSSASAQLLALNPDGTLKWSYAIQQIHTTLDDIYCSPTIGSDGTIYFSAENGLLHALNLDGTLNWTFDTKNGMNWSSPAIAGDGAIYFGAGDGNLYALKSSSAGLGNSHWPKFRYNNQNTGRTY